MIPVDHIQAATLQVDALNRLLEKLWCERVEMRERIYDAMRDLRMVKLTLTEAAASEGELTS
jgi:hypothetical protein